jgi:hypothetical protein
LGSDPSFRRATSSMPRTIFKEAETTAELGKFTPSTCGSRRGGNRNGLCTFRPRIFSHRRDCPTRLFTKILAGWRAPNAIQKDATVGRVVIGSPGTFQIGEGNYDQSVKFQPISAGSTVLTLTEPTGYSTPNSPATWPTQLTATVGP